MTELTLTDQDVRALRLAESVTLHHSGGVASIHTILRGYPSGDMRIYTKVEQTLFPDPDVRGSGDRSRMITCQGEVNGYDASGYWSGEFEPVLAACFAMVYSARGKPEWDTVAGLLRAGDALTLVWLAGNNNQYLNDAGLYLDKVSMQVDRGRRRAVFPLMVTVCPDNTARMVKRYG